MELKLMTFNIRTDVAADGPNNWKYRFSNIAKFMELSGASVIGTQEGLIAMLHDLEQGISSYQWFGEDRADPTCNEHCAIFYKDKDVLVNDKGTFWLSETPEISGSVSWKSSLPRICTWGEFQMIAQPNKMFRVFNLHLDHKSHEAREKGIRLVIEKISEMNKTKYLPSIVMGDFNTEPDTIAIQFIKQANISLSGTKLVDVQESHGENNAKTFHSFEGGIEGQPIDYIFVSDDFVIKESKVLRNKIDENYLSDHYPVITTLYY